MLVDMGGHRMDYIKDSAVFRALDEPVRLRILERLAGGELCACDLLATLGISQPTLSHHMKVLTEAALVESRRKGIWVHYSIRPDATETLKGFVHELETSKVPGERACCG
jgi:ArsR family transcriptional regulator, arsenate/arsenite/antimonite-responsive transcriptional repressor